MDLERWEAASQVRGKLESRKRITRKGVDYWLAREIQPVLGYEQWRQFRDVIRKAKIACENAGYRVENHFADVRKMVRTGSRAVRQIEDYALTKYACFLVAMSGDATKPEIAKAKAYFAVQTHRMEILDRLAMRIEHRKMVTDAMKALQGMAKDAKVINYPRFFGAGLYGMYKLRLAEIRERKGLPSTANIYDYQGVDELSMNAFRATLTKSRLAEKRIDDEDKAVQVAEEAGAEVRSSVLKFGGEMPEDLPTEEDIKKVKRRIKKGESKSSLVTKNRE